MKEKVLRKRVCKNKLCKIYFRPTEANPDIQHCSPNCALDILGAGWAKQREQQEKARKRAERKQDKQHRQQKRENKQNDRKYQFKLTKREAQKLANRIDKDLPCICCGRERDGIQFCGGHCKSAGGHPELALDLRNIHGQANQLCNMQKSGNISGDKHSKGFKQGIIDRYGRALLDYLEKYHPPKNETCEELIQIRALYAAEIRYIDKHGEPSRDWRAL